MEINIGELLHTHFKNKRIRRAALARLMNVGLRTVLIDEKKNTIQIKRLIDYCVHLKHNFFMDAALLLPKEFTTTTDIFEAHNRRIAQLETDLNLVTAERDVLIKVMQK